MPDKLGSSNFGGVALPEAPSEQELRVSYWWVIHRNLLRRLGIAALIAVDMAMLGFAGWGFADWLAFGGLSEDRAIRELTSPAYGRFGGVGTPAEILADAPIVLAGTVGRYDVLVPIRNANEGYWAELTYHFLIGGQETPARTAFLLPGQSKYLAELGVEAEGSAAELRVTRRVWHRVRLGTGEPSYTEWAGQRLAIVAEDPRFFAADPAAAAPAGRASFTLANATAYSYYDVDVLVLLFRSGELIGANRVRLDALEAGERRPMDLYWYHPLPQTTRVEVLADVNILDPAAYRAPR